MSNSDGTTKKRIALIDLSGIARAAWHRSENEDISSCFNRTVSQVTQISAGHDVVAVCVDRPPYRRCEIDPNYKAHRAKAPAAMYEQFAAVEAQLDADGYHIVGAQGYEADDILGAIALWAEDQGHDCIVYSADKDMLQLVNARVSVISTATGAKYDTEESVKAKFGVAPGLISDWLALVGDKSDGIPGVAGVGPVKAAQWLNEIGPLEVILANPERLPDKFREVVRAGKDAIAQSWKLARLMTDAPIKPHEIMQPKARKDAPKGEPTTISEEEEMQEPEVIQPRTQGAASPSPAATAPGTALALAPTPQATDVSWDKALEPRGPKQAWDMANALYKSKLFGDFPNPEAILAIVMTGRSLGMDTVASLRSFHLIKGKPSMSAALMVGIVKRHPICEWFRIVESTDKRAEWETKRRDEPEPTRLSYTIEEAGLAGLLNNDQWKKRPKTMLRWRAAVELARMVYSDVIAGLYSVEEMQDAA